jgi:hypothetical protein
MWNQTFAPDFVPGPVPRNSLAPTSGPDAIYSGLLECPLTTRVRKEIQANYDVKSSGPPCGDMIIQTAPECFQAVAKLLPNATTTTSTVDSNSSLPAGCSIERAASGTIDITFNKVRAGVTSSATCGGTSSVVSGTAKSLVQLHVSMDKSAEEVHITMSGPSAVWYGVGFNASEMSDAPWAIIVDGHGAVTERKLVDQKAGTLLKTTVKVLSSKVTDGVRTVTMSRAMKGAGEQYYSFDYTGPSTMPFINAVGSTTTFAYHKVKSPASITLLPVSAPACVCSGSELNFGDGSCKGGISYVPTYQKEDTGTGTVNFNNRCAPDPASQLLSQHNPTCDLRTYVGGQLTCHHMWSLLVSCIDFDMVAGCFAEKNMQSVAFSCGRSSHSSLHPSPRMPIKRFLGRQSHWNTISSGGSGTKNTARTMGENRTRASPVDGARTLELVVVSQTIDRAVCCAILWPGFESVHKCR